MLFFFKSFFTGWRLLYHPYPHPWDCEKTSRYLWLNTGFFLAVSFSDKEEGNSEELLDETQKGCKILTVRL